jgi:hypothetical protein
MSLASYEEARPWAKAIKEELLERRMPPWPAVRGFGEFRNAPRLSQRDVDAIVDWVEGGAPRGDAALLPAGPLLPPAWPLGTPDLVLAPDKGHDVAPDADERVDFVLSTRLRSETWLKAADLQPGDGSVVHCATFSVDGAQAALLGTWVPGVRPVALDGMARRLPPQARLRVRVHYKGSGQPAVDKSSLGLYVAAARPPRELRELALTSSAPSKGRSLRGTVRLAEAVEAIAVVPTADTRLASVQASLYRPDGTSEVLVWTRDARADWRPTYFFKKPVAIPKGSRVEAIAHLRESGGGGEPAEPLLTLFYAKASARRAGASGS